jgi:hypothetical protein
MPPITINTKDKINITVTNILVKLHIKTGNAVAHVTHVSSPTHTLALVSSMQLPIKGTEVLRDIQQHTHGSEHFLQGSVPGLYQSLHTH